MQSLLGAIYSERHLYSSWAITLLKWMQVSLSLSFPPSLPTSPCALLNLCSLPTLTLPIALSVCWAGVFSFLLSCISLPPLCASSPYHRIPPYLRQPAVLVRAVSHSRCLGLQFSSPPPAPFLPLSQPEWGTITSSERACSALSTISIFTESWDDRFHKVPGWGLNEIGQV